MIKKIIDIFYYIFEIFSNYFPFFSRLYIKIHEFSVKKEIELSHISKSEKVLHIGCGAIPYTSIVLGRETNAEIVAIDNKQIIVNAANKYIKRCNLSDRIKIELGNGKTYNPSGFDVIIISYGITRQDLVLKNVINSMKNKARIILRRTTIKKDDYINSIVRDFSVCKRRLLLTQESILIVKQIDTLILDHYIF